MKCAYCGAPLRHRKVDGQGYLWFIFLGGPGNPAQPRWCWQRPSVNAVADGFECSAHCGPAPTSSA